VRGGVEGGLETGRGLLLVCVPSNVPNLLISEGGRKGWKKRLF